MQTITHHTMNGFIRFSLIQIRWNPPTAALNTTLSNKLVGTHILMPSFGRSDEITYLVEKASGLTSPERGMRKARTAATMSSAATSPYRCPICSGFATD
jgi:hypothetical protein